MAVYEYVCMSCEHPFEERRSITESVDTALRCPSCGGERVRRRFSVFATGGGKADAAPSGGCCGGGGGCVCGH